MEVHAHAHTSLDPDSHRGRKKWLHKVKVTIQQDKNFYHAIEKRGERLIALIQKEYHLKD